MPPTFEPTARELRALLRLCATRLVLVPGLPDVAFQNRVRAAAGTRRLKAPSPAVVERVHAFLAKRALLFSTVNIGALLGLPLATVEAALAWLHYEGRATQVNGSHWHVTKPKRRTKR